MAEAHFFDAALVRALGRLLPRAVVPLRVRLGFAGKTTRKHNPPAHRGRRA